MRSPGRYAAALLLAFAITACGPDEDAVPDRGAPAPTVDSHPKDRPDRRVSRASSKNPAGPASSYSDWELGARPLPLRPDGLGVVRPTPAELVVRRYATVDLLPPPSDHRFHSSIGPVTESIRERMGETWSPACPVGLADLRYVTVSFRGFDGLPHTGELVVAASEAEDVVSVFAALFEADFPIEEMRLPTTADLEAHPTGDGNNTAALVCRSKVGGSSWSAHAYGLAIDVNPFNNPYQKGDVVLPELASSYLDRSWHRPGMIGPGSIAVREFARIGWSWGGGWTSLKDYQHFSATGS